MEIRYQGVPLKELLDHAGLKPDRREIRKTVVLLAAKDGYQASFFWSELYNSSLGDGVIVVLRQDNVDLLEVEGFLPALRSFQDLRSGPRHVRWLTQIEVLLPASRGLVLRPDIAQVAEQSMRLLRQPPDNQYFTLDRI